MMRVLVMLWAFASIVYAGKVVRVNSSKNLVLLDSGLDSNYREGMRVCFKGKGGEKEAGEGVCGVLVKVKKTTSLVKLKSSKGIAKGDVAELQVEAIPLNVEKGFLVGRFLWLGHPLAAMPPTSGFKVIHYNGAESGQGESLWTQEGDHRNLYGGPLLGFGLESEWLSLDLRAGVTFKLYRGFASREDHFHEKGNERFVVTSQGRRIYSYGFYGDYVFDFLGNFTFGVGGQLDVMNLLFLGHLVDREGLDPNRELFFARLTQGVVSLRVPFRYDWQVFQKVGLSFGFTLMLPFMDVFLAPVVKAVDELHVSTGPESQGQDVLDSLDLDQSDYAADVVFGLSYSWL